MTQRGSSDARTEIADLPAAAYDVVVGDALGSLAVTWQLATSEMVQQVRRVLRPGGGYLLNVMDNRPLALARAPRRQRCWRRFRTSC